MGSRSRATAQPSQGLRVHVPRQRVVLLYLGLVVHAYLSPLTIAQAAVARIERGYALLSASTYVTIRSAGPAQARQSGAQEGADVTACQSAVQSSRPRR